ncbi:MAG: FkbM family methyltransferase, partial [Bacteroidota bacterium]
LSNPIPILSFEYFSYSLNEAMHCISILNQLGSYEFNYSYGESQVLELQEWKSYTSFSELVNNFNPGDRSGDIYARLKS